MIAGKDITLAADFDINDVNLKDLKALNLFKGTVIPQYKKSDLKKYLQNTDKSILEKYEKIYRVPNGKILVIESGQIR